ncbi:MAG TPA: hypothetical protein VML55_17340, partial [Planctomycetaceae bacterium]|nr:hypothetical protein [Planctomycetaceae bacterium]
TIDVTAGQLLAGVHYRKAMNDAKKRAALRELENFGPPAITCEDVLECLVDTAADVAHQMEADRSMLVEQLRIKVPVARIDAVPVEQLQAHRFLKLHSA